MTRLIWFWLWMIPLLIGLIYITAVVLLMTLSVSHSARVFKRLSTFFEAN